MIQLTALFHGFLILNGLGIASLATEYIFWKIRQKEQDQENRDFGEVEGQYVHYDSDFATLCCLCNDLRLLKLRIVEFMESHEYESIELQNILQWTNDISGGGRSPLRGNKSKALL